MDDSKKGLMKILSPVRAIRAKCLDCCAGQAKEVKVCQITDCPLWGFRNGKNPNRKGIGNHSAKLRNTKLSSIQPERMGIVEAI